MKNIQKQKGLTLIEIIVALGIMGAVVVGVNAMINQASSDIRAAVTGMHMKAVGDAATEYIKDNYAAITGVATATTPALIRVSDLISGGYLSSGFSAQNAAGQSVCVLVLEPSANDLTGMVVAHGGTAIDDLTLGQVAATIGASGGGIYSTATSTFRGAMGGWSTAVGSFANANHLGVRCDGTAGAVPIAAGRPSMALWFADGLSVAPTLYRDAVPGNAALNTMNTPILMGAGTVQTEGGACTSTGALGRDSTGAVVSCQGGTWKKQKSAFWGDPVSVSVAMPACSAANANEVRVRYGYASAPTSRALICNGTGWIGVGVDGAGNMTVPGTVTAGALSVSGAASAGSLSVSGATTLTGNVTTGNNLTVGNNIIVNNVTASGRVTANTLHPQLVATANTACSPNGLIAQTSTGQLLSCTSGTWKKYVQPNTYTNGSVLTTGNSTWEIGGACISGGYASGICIYQEGGDGTTIQKISWSDPQYPKTCPLQTRGVVLMDYPTGCP